MVKPFKPLCRLLLPAVYNDALTYYEDLCKISEKLNEVIDFVNSYDDSLKQYVNEQVQAATTYMENQLASVKQELEDDLSALELACINKYIDLEKQIAVLNTSIINNNALLQGWVTSQINQLKEELADIMPTVLVHNPFSGETSTIQQFIDDVWSYLRYGALSVDEYAQIQLTVDQYAEYRLTVMQYALWARFKLRPGNPWAGGLILSPVTYDWRTAQSVFDQLAAFHQNAPTVDEYESYGHTVSAYAGFELTVKEYDWEGKQHLDA